MAASQPAAQARGRGHSPGLLVGLPLFLVLVAAAFVAGRQLHDPVLKTVLVGSVLAVTIAIPLLRRAAVLTLMLAGLAGASAWTWQNRQHIATISRAWRVSAARAVDRLGGLAGLDSGVTNPGNWRMSALVRSVAGPYQAYLDQVDPRDPEINRVASRIVEACGDADHVCETALLLGFVTEEIAYRNDPRGQGDYVKSPRETLAAGAGDCEDKTILLVSLLESLGNKTYMVFTETHTYPLVCYDTPLDGLLQQKRKEMGRTAFRRYLVTLAPRHDVEALRRASRQVVSARIDGQYCYPLEPTARGSWIGQDHREPPVAIFDSVGRQRVAMRR